MKTSAILCAALAGTLGFSTLASAQTFRMDGQRTEQRHEQRDDRHDRRDARQDRRADRRDDRHEQRAERRDDRHDRREAWRDARRDDRHQYQYRAQPSYGYGNGYYRAGPRFHRGGYLPYEYRQRNYYVTNWNAYPHLYAPPYGHQWVNVDGEFLLVALATGLIANALLN